jgi:DNA-binding beta-propeller fold protein YncE
MNKIREIDLDGDGLHFVTKAGDNLWVYVDAEDRIAVIGLSPEDAIVKFRNSVYNDGLEPGDVRINLIDDSKAVVCIKDDCRECSVELE